MRRVKTTVADSEPPEKGEDTAGRDIPQLPVQRYVVRRAKAEQGRREAEGRLLGRTPLRLVYLEPDLPKLPLPLTVPC